MNWDDKAPLLGSYAYIKTWGERLNHFANARLFVDSGAFTAATLGITIDLTEYSEWLVEHKPIIYQAAGLDVIGDWRATARNDDLMRDRIGHQVTIVPTWHIGSPESELERLCRTNTYIAIGGCVPYASRPKVLLAHLIRAHRIAREYGTRLHGLGVTGGQTLVKLPWHTVDSSSWSQGLRYGAVKLRTQRGETQNIPINKGPLPPAKAALVRRYDGDPARVGSPAFFKNGPSTVEEYRRDRDWIAQSAARSTWVLADALDRTHRTGVTIYLANTAYVNLAAAMIGYTKGSPYRKGGT